VNESHIGASLYDCTSSVCYLTYGYILQGSNVLTCNTSGCGLNNEIISGSTCSEVGAGAITSNGKFCETSSSTGISIPTTLKSVYVKIEKTGNFPETKSGDKIILNITEKGTATKKLVISIINVDGYYLLNKRLYYCTSSNKNCVDIEIKPGYYKGVNEIIECSKDECNVYDKSIVFGSDDKPLYNAINNFPVYGEVIAVATENKIVALSTDKYVLLNDKTNSLAVLGEKLNKLYKCSSKTNNCSQVVPQIEGKNVDTGYFITEMENAKYIQCAEDTCEIINTISTKCTTLDGELINNNGVYSICINSKNVVLSENINSSYILNSDKNKFPDNNNYIVIGDGNVIGLGIIDTSESEETSSVSKPIEICDTVSASNACKSGGSVVNGYCYNIDTKTKAIKLYRTNENNKCTLVHPVKEENYPLVKLFNGNKIVDSENVPGIGTKMFYCTGSECRLTTGYYKLENKIYKCDSVKCEESEVPVGMTITSNSYYYLSTNVKNFPGAENNEEILVESGEDYLVVFKSDGYYLINSNNKMENEEEGTVSRKRGSGNNLFLCDSTTSNCIKQTKLSDGYYINSGSSVFSKAIISCKNNECNLASVGAISDDGGDDVDVKEVDKDSNFKCTTNDKKNIIVRYKDKIKICVDEGGVEWKNDQTVKYYPSSIDEESILVELSSNYAKVYEDEGYMLISKNIKIEEIKGKGELYQCEKGESKVNCRKVDVDNGIYFIEKSETENMFIKCTSGICEITKSDNSKCNSIGSIVYSDGSFKLCRSLNQQVEIMSIGNNEGYTAMVTIEKSEDFPGVKSDNSDCMLKISNKSIDLIKLDSYVVVDNYNVVIEEGEKTGRLYGCVKGICSEVNNPKNNYYIKTNYDGKPVELINCIESKCSVVVNEDVNEEFYVKYDGNLIQCVKPQQEEGLIECKEKDLIEGYFKQASIGENTDNIIECNKELGCRSLSSVSDGWYVNNAYKESSYKTSYDQFPLMKCNNNKCEIVENAISDKCEKTGEFIISNKVLKFCETKDKPLEISKQTGSYKFVNVESNDFFEGNQIIALYITNNSVTKVEKEGFYYSDSNSIMYKCKNAICEEYLEANVMVKDEIKSILYSSDKCEGKCKWSRNTEEGIIFLDNKNQKITKSSGDDLEIEQVFKCKKIGSESICKDIENSTIGYYYNKKAIDENNKVKEVIYKNGEDGWSIATNIKKCHLSYKSYTCFVNDEENADEEENSVEINPGEICEDNGKYYLALNVINTGIDYKNCVQILDGNESKYYTVFEGINSNKVYLVDNYSAINIGDGFNGSESVHVIDSITYKPTFDEKYKENEFVNTITYSGYDLYESKTITCTKIGCTSINSVNCSYDFSQGKCKLTSGYINEGQTCISERGITYLATEKVSTTLGSCTPFKGDKMNLINANGVIYGIDDESNVMKFGQGIYIIDDKNYLVSSLSSIDLNKENNNKMYICNNEGCKEKKSCNNVNEYMYDSKYGLLKCDAKSNAIYKTSEEGYLVNQPWNNLLKCSGYRCDVIDEVKGMEGYYITKYDNEMIIKCLRDKGKFTCEYEKIIKCNFKDGKCKSNEVDLLRNSYCYSNKKLIYVENFIKAGDEGKCISSGDDDYYFKYSESKFLGNEKRDELIKVNEEYIVSIYEDDVGYYVIDTKEGKGIVKSTSTNKTRMYECRKNNCEEIVINELNDKDIYINKASKERMIMKQNSDWIVKNNSCTKNLINTSKCQLSQEIKMGDIFYVEDNDDIKFYMVKEIDIKDYTEINKHGIINKKAYQKILDDMYILNENGQSFTLQKEPGYYIFVSGEKLKEDDYQTFNLVPYSSTVIMSIDDIESNLLIYNYNNNEWEVDKLDNSEGYYWNKADINNTGIIIERMKIKPKSNDENEKKKRSETYKEKLRALNNKCKSETKNICVSTEKEQTIPKGSACIVTDGENRGLYYANLEINNKSKSQNCIKYNDENAYQYIKESTEFAGELHENIIISIGENSVKPFNNEENTGFYVIGNDNKILSSNELVVAKGYECKTINDESEERYECALIAKPSQYYYANVFSHGKGSVVFAKDTKWNVVNDKAFYFMNESNTGAKINENEGEKVNDKIVNYYPEIKNKGYYLNSATSDVVIVKYDDEIEIVESLECTNICSNNIDQENVVSETTSCYNKKDKKLYVVVSEEEKDKDGNDINVNKCYGASGNKVKYLFLENDNVLYKLDGMSVISMTDGYFIFDENMEEFNSKYPKTPKLAISCTNSECSLIESISNNEIIVNMVGNKTLLKYYAKDKKFANVNTPGYYFFDEKYNSITGENEEEMNYMNVFTVSKDGTTIEQSIDEFYKDNNLYNESVSENDIIVNAAKSNENIMVSNGKYLYNSKITYNKELDLIVFDGKYNSNESKNVFVYYENGLYLLKPKYIKMVSEGLYIMNEGLPFDSNEWKEISNEKDICYYNGSSCDNEILNEYKKNNNYMINYATEKISIIEYNKDKWRNIKEDGYYFFFENGSSINSEDRRVSKVIQIVNGDAIDITNTSDKDGFYIMNDLVVEGKGNEWKDAVSIVRSVEYNDINEKCNAYEKGEDIVIDKFCYDNEKGICIPKLNCIFSKNDSVNYYLIENKLYSIGKNLMKRVQKSGIYVIGKDRLVFDSKTEKTADLYECEDGVCERVEKPKSNYYMNIADINSNNSIILYYNEDHETWKKTTEEGLYFFDIKGYPVNMESEVEYVYEVTSRGNVVTNIKEKIGNGIYKNKSEIKGNMFIENINGVMKIKDLPTCTVDIKKGKIKSKNILKEGDICIDNNILVFIKNSPIHKRQETDSQIDQGKETNDQTDQGSETTSQIVQGSETTGQIDQEDEPTGQTNEGNEGKETNEQTDGDEIEYEGIIITDSIKKEIYVYNKDELKLSKLSGESLIDVIVDGIVIIDDETLLPLDSNTLKKSTMYNCNGGKCNLVESSSIKNDSYNINVLNEKSPLVKYKGNGEWQVESTRGYYFLKDDMSEVKVNEYVKYAFEVNNLGVQKDITKKAKIGYYLNKITDNKVILSNDSDLWSSGSELQKCNVSTVEEGIICKTLVEDEVINEGEYCYDENNKQLYLLTGEASFETSSANCEFGTNEKPKYVYNKKLMGNEDASKYLIMLTSDTIRIVDTGYYIIDNVGYSVVTNTEGSENTKIYNCTDDECTEVSSIEEGIYITEKGDIVKFGENGKLEFVKQNGLYFFTENNEACKKEEDIVSRIIKMTEDGAKKEELALDSLEKGGYVNEAMNKSLAKYDGSEWSITLKECKYNEANSTCEGDVTNVGDYCISDGSIYFIKSIDGENKNTCIKGNNESPVILNVLSKLNEYKEKSVVIIEGEGYYVIDSTTGTVFTSSEKASSILYKCEYEGDCNLITPEIGNYLNRSPKDLNIVQYPTGKLEESMTNGNKCTVINNENGSVCISSDGELNNGDVCIGSGSLYLIESSEKCLLANDEAITYQIIDKKLYQLDVDSVIQKIDGYYFINKNKQPIHNLAEYERAGTVGYMCSAMGDCYLIEPQGIKYYPDYTTKNNGLFRVIKFDENKSNMSKRQNDEDTSGYENIDKEGIYKLDDGSYAECKFDENDEIICNEIDEPGAKMTNEGELFVCKKNDDEEVECSQAIEGGYYEVDGELYNCEPNEENDKLVCKEMSKEGYFISNPDDILYECVEIEEETTMAEDPTPGEDMEISKVFGDKNADGDEVDENELPLLDDEDSDSDEDNTTSTTVSTTTTTTESSTTTTEETTTTTTTLEPTETPLNVECKPVECVKGEIKSYSTSEGEVEMYICKNINSDDDENEVLKWKPNEDNCESGNYVKEGSYYNCEDEKENVDEDSIQKPNTEHTSTEKTTTTTTTTTTTVSATTTEDTTTTTTTTGSTTTDSSTSKTTTESQSSSTSSETTTTTTTTTKKSSTTKTTTTTTKTATSTETKTAGARSFIRTLPSLSFYLILFIFSYYIFI
jgi:hypothetical protein